MTVNVLKISFVAACLCGIEDEKDVQLLQKQFEKVMWNIFEHFDNLKHVVIELKISTYLALQLKTINTRDDNIINDDANGDQHDDKIRMKESALDVLHSSLDGWIKLFCNQFELNFDKIMAKYGKTNDSFFKLSLFVTPGDLKNCCDNPIDMFKYLYQKQHIDCDVFQNREQSAANFILESNNANNTHQSMDQTVALNRKQFFTSYWDELQAIKTMILCMIEHIDIYQKTFTV